MGDAVKITPHIPFTSAQFAIFSLLIIPIIPRSLIQVAIANRSLILFISCLTTNRYIWNDVRIARNVSHADNLQRNRCDWFCPMYKF
jgi:hypothetical protein